MLVPRKGPFPWLFPSLLAGLAAIAAGAGEPRAHAAEPPKPGLRSLRGLTPPLPDLSGIVKDRTWAVVLGKALFFDQQLGSDGQACASCHYSAGADSRVTNQLAPGKDDASPPDPATLVFGGLDMDSDPPAQTGLMASGNPAGADVTLVPEDFPFHQLVDPDDCDSDILFTTNDRVSSQGTFGGNFMGIGGAQSPDDVCSDVPDFVFHAGGARVRRVAGRNTPTNVNAIFNTRNFWDGRANGVFNGTGVFGRRDVQNDPAARVVVMKSNGAAALAALDLKNASAASQAAGPPGSSVEMACAGRKFALVGRKMFARQPLALQAIDAQDSVFGAPSQVGDIRAPCGHGLSLTYEDLVKLAFEPRLWKDAKKRRITAQGNVVPHPGGFLQRELNFPLFFGVAVMLYEATLVSDDSPVDRFFGCEAAQCGAAVPPDPSALTADEQAGLALFQGKGKCSRCHSGPLLTSAAHVEVPGFPPSQEVIARRNMADGAPALQDEGFFNTGVTPVHEDLGLGGTDPYGNPLSYTRQWVEKLRTGAALVDPFTVSPCNFRVPFSAIFCSAVPTTPAALAAIRVVVDGAFKTPGLRNVALTPPYFHDGGTATLDQVIDFYNRGGNCRGPASDDSTGTGPLGDGALGPGSARGSNLGPAIVPLGLTAQEKAQLKAFMLALTDDRVRCRKAPFDGPELSIPNGHAPVDVNPADGRLDAVTMVVPATGANGLPSWSCVPNTGDLFDVAPQ